MSHDGSYTIIRPSLYLQFAGNVQNLTGSRISLIRNYRIAFTPMQDRITKTEYSYLSLDFLFFQPFLKQFLHMVGIQLTHLLQQMLSQIPLGTLFIDTIPELISMYTRGSTERIATNLPVDGR